MIKDLSSAFTMSFFQKKNCLHLSHLHLEKNCSTFAVFVYIYTYGETHSRSLVCQLSIFRNFLLKNYQLRQCQNKNPTDNPTSADFPKYFLEYLVNLYEWRVKSALVLLFYCPLICFEEVVFQYISWNFFWICHNNKFLQKCLHNFLCHHKTDWFAIESWDMFSWWHFWSLKTQNVYILAMYPFEQNRSFTMSSSCWSPVWWNTAVCFYP